MRIEVVLIFVYQAQALLSNTEVTNLWHVCHKQSLYVAFS